ncbi:sodium/bile acid cotransporter 7-like [Neocloeon triangulifer]|uniref:sodium/bile acid cotransporter 7-like n=1 Tax=Neocloeon triangulifer TaxID=2078957 RepID=UPI00286F5DE8|nr:sodium/bile acid cotransporter 7-like [Neocloeon triangulifer]
MGVKLKSRSKRVDLKEKLKENWLLVGILFAIIFAQIDPSIGSRGGLLRPEITVKYFCVAGIFFISGLSLKSEQLYLAIRQVRLHVFIQCFTLFLFPLLVQVFVFFLRPLGLNEWIVKGLVTVSCMPPPVSSAVILTRAVGGNEAAAIFNSAFGSFLGIIVTPLTLLYFLGVSTLVPLVSTVIQLGMTVLLPLLFGQISRRAAGNWAQKNSPLLGFLSQLALLLVIYATFCDTFINDAGHMDASDILFAILFVVLLQVGLMSLVFSITSRLHRWFSPSDVVAILFCSTHKSLTLGIPMLRILFGGYAHLSQISLPLLVYHPTQILLGSIVAAPLREWLRDSHHKSHYSLGI